MYSETQISELFGNDALQYAQNKQQGGASNEKGNTYENYYAAYKISLLAADVIENQANIRFYSQILSFVDDLIILNEDTQHLQHHQLKNSPNIYWGNGLRSIADDFSKQKTLNQSTSTSCDMVLVVSDQSVQERLTSSCPGGIQPFSQVVYFPFKDSLMQVVRAVPDFMSAIEYLCAFDQPAPDKM